MLEQAGFEILEAADGQEGLDILREHKPHIITCDLSMPYMNGYEFLTTVRQDPEHRDIPIIVVTAIGQEEEAAKATEMGANAYLTKPFSSNHLLETIQAQLEKDL